MKLAILRRLHTGDDGTLGHLFEAMREFECWTLELPWRGNRQGLSCIPAGAYFVGWRYSPSSGRYYYYVQDVPGRSGVRFEIGNWAGDKLNGWKSDSLGCIFPGEGVYAGDPTDPDEQMMVVRSGDALTKLIEYFGKEMFVLFVFNAVRSSARRTLTSSGRRSNETVLQ